MSAYLIIKDRMWPTTFIHEYNYSDRTKLKTIITNLANSLHILDIILSKPTIQLFKRGVYVQYKVRYAFEVFYKNVEQNIGFSFSV